MEGENMGLSLKGSQLTTEQKLRIAVSCAEHELREVLNAEELLATTTREEKQAKLKAAAEALAEHEKALQIDRGNA